MGLAASQARFLGLTARKTNTEYEGQQVNQQRTALANESAGLFNKMLKLNVPLPPDPNNFYNTRYNFDYGGTNYQILTMSAGTDADTKITAQYYENVVKGMKFTQAGAVIGKTNDGDYYAKINGSELPIDQITYPNLATSVGLPANTMFYHYTVPAGTPTAQPVDYYFTEDQLKAFLGTQTLGPGEESGTGHLGNYYEGSASEIRYKDFPHVVLNMDTSGKFSTITITEADGSQSTSSLALERVRDDAGYENAMYLYTTEKELYDRTISDINAQSEVLQQQDRTLELRLKQLDTEQAALQTEMEAVKKVIEKNVESTFKTFA